MGKNFKVLTNFWRNLLLDIFCAKANKVFASGVAVAPSAGVAVAIVVVI